MKQLYVFVFFIAVLVAGCKKDGVSTKFDDSLNAFNQFKASSNNTYTYTASSGSWTSSSVETKFIVVNGHVTGREVHLAYPPNSPATFKDTTIVETGAALNTHREGHEVLTLDQVYVKAQTEWLKADKKMNDVYFETNNNGMISSAGFVPKGCQDDCFTGITITEINLYVKPIK